MNAIEVLQSQNIANMDILKNIIMSLVLIMTRFVAFFNASPFFSQPFMSQNVRTGVTMALSILFVPGIFEEFQSTPTLSNYFFPLIIKELIIGFFLGILIWMPVRGLALTGAILDTQRGAAQGEEMNVLFGGTATVTGRLLSQLFSGFFFSSGGFLIVLMILFESVSIWPPTKALPPFGDEAAYLFVKITGMLIFTALVFALPISGFMLLADIAIAFIAKSAPTLNALTFGMPVKSAILIIMLFFYTGIAYDHLIDGFDYTIDMMKRLFHE